MSLSSRRTFLKATGAVAAAHLSSAAHLSARPLKQPLGLQLYSLREQLPKDFEGSLAKRRESLIISRRYLLQYLIG